ncbi:MAG: class I SAM-dependent methyltransferase [Thermoleophilaceae bacterium]
MANPAYDLTRTACPACGGRLAPWIDVPAGEPSDSRDFPLGRCAACGTAVTQGDLPGPQAYEEGVYAPGAPRAAPMVRTIQRLTVGQPTRILTRAGLGPGARVLDAGAGRGRLVAELRRRGFAAEGIEPSARSAGTAASAALPVARRSIDEHEDSGLDAVVLWHVLEHLEDPASALERVRSWLRPGGLVLVGVPNVGSLQARIAGPAWMHFDVPRHRLHLTPGGLRCLVDRSGLEPGPVDHMVWEHNPAAMWMALLSRAGMSPAYPFHLLKRNAPARGQDLALAIGGLPLLGVAAAMEAAAAAVGRGGTIAALARVS